MSCCDDLEGTAPQVNFGDLPDETFCCMGRMAYTLAALSERALLNAEPRRPWDSMTELEKLQKGRIAKELLLTDESRNNVFEELMRSILRTMTSLS